MARHRSRSSLSSRSVWQHHNLNKKCAIDTHLSATLLELKCIGCGVVRSRLLSSLFTSAHKLWWQQNGSSTRIACLSDWMIFTSVSSTLRINAHYNIPVVACYMEKMNVSECRSNYLTILLAHDHLIRYKPLFT